MVERVIRNYKAWYKVWSEAYIPKLLFKPKWFKDEVDLKVGDLVYFQKSESELGSSWMLGMIAAVEIGRDNLIRIVEIKYRNASEQQDRTNMRSVRKVCKIWSENDWNIQDDLMELAARLQQVEGGQATLDDVQLPQPQVHAHHAAQVQGSLPAAAADSCCCMAHCAVLHDGGTRLRPYKALNNIQHVPFELQPKVPYFKADMVKAMEELCVANEPSLDNLSSFMLNFTNT